MDVTSSDFEDLVGAYALDALEPAEVAVVDEYLAANPDAAREVERLRAAAAWIGAAGALEPPPSLRNRLLGQAVVAATPVDAFAAESERFGALIETLGDDDLRRPTHNGLDVHGLIAHVAAVDGAFADSVTDPAIGLVTASEVPAITERARRETEAFDREALIRYWRRRRDELAAAGAAAGPDAEAAGYSMSSALVIRAFEAWVHNDDIRAAIGLPSAPPAAPALRAMADLAVGNLPLALAVAGREHPGKTAKLLLTGPGGGAWLVPGAPETPAGAVPDVEIRVGVVDFCRRFADRLAAADVPVEIDGDEAFARDLIEAAPAFAGL